MLNIHSLKRIALVSNILILGSFCQAESLTFSLYDSYGMKVKSQDYQGVPLFLEFGACW
jgi:hypothetical protein